MNIILYPDDRLKKVSQPVHQFNGDLLTFIERLKEKMYERGGIGLAAPQVGIARQIFVTSDEHYSVFINPKIFWSSEAQVDFEEGCLSFPQLRAEVARPERIGIEFQTVEGQRIQCETGGLLARIIQHEIDHLQGRMFFDHLSRTKKNILLKKYSKINTR